MISLTCPHCRCEFLCERRRKFCGPICLAAHVADRPLAPSTRYRATKVNGKKESKHRVIVEAALCRKLTSGEVVHHKNGVKTDNRIENLEVLTHQQHAAHHNRKHPLTKLCMICGVEFKPHPTKRERAKSCGSDRCKRTAIGVSQAKTEWVTVGLETLTISQWSEKTGVKYATIYNRLRKGWNPKDAVSPSGRARVAGVGSAGGD